MSRNRIDTVTDSDANAADQDYTPVTGTDVIAGTKTKRGIDTYGAGSNLASTHALLGIILGTLPSPNYNQISRTVNDDGSETFIFSYNNTSLYQVDITDPQGNYMIKVNDLSLAGSIVLMDGTGSMLTIVGDDYIKLEG